MRIKNIKGTSDRKCKCGSWVKHWETFTGLPANVCSVTDCYSTDQLVGAHVQKDVEGDANWYVCLLCKQHNSQAGTMEILSEMLLVSANVSETCGQN